MALGLLLVLFMVMSIISVMGLVLLFLLKGEKGRSLCFTSWRYGAWSSHG